MNPPSATVSEDAPSGLLAVSSRAPEDGELGRFACPLIMPMLDSARPPAYDGRLSAVLHPVKNMSRLHAPIRPARGILPIVLSSPCDSLHATPQSERVAPS